MQPITGFFHIARMPNSDWEKIFYEILNKIIISKLYDKCDKVYLCFLGGNDKPKLKPEFHKYNKFKIIYCGNDLKKYEFPTLEILHNHCLNNEGIVFYIHTKGTSKTLSWWKSGRKDRKLDDTKHNAKRWRQFMSYFIIDQHTKCIEGLKTHDVCGTDWVEKMKIDLVGSYFSGNFWWANSNYIKRLPRIEKIENKNRYWAEFWLGCQVAKPLCLWRSKSSWRYFHTIEPTDYRKFYL